MPDVATEQKVSDVFEPRKTYSRWIAAASAVGQSLSRRLGADHSGLSRRGGAVQKYDGVPPYETTQQYDADGADGISAGTGANRGQK